MANPPDDASEDSAADDAAASKKQARQAIEEAKRQKEILRWEAMDYWSKYYIERLHDEANVTIKVTPTDETPNETPLPNRAMLEAQTPIGGKRLENGVYNIEVTTDSDVQNIKLHVTDRGFKPEPPTVEGWRTAIRAVIQEQHADTIKLTVSAKPEFPADAANTLIMWTKMCIDEGVEAKLSDDALTFLKNADDKAVPAQVKSEINKLIQMSAVRMQESSMRAHLDDMTKLAKAPVKEAAEKLDDALANFEKELSQLEKMSDRFDKVEAIKQNLKAEKNARLLVESDKVARGSTIEYGKYDKEKITKDGYATTDPSAGQKALQLAAVLMGMEKPHLTGKKMPQHEFKHKQTEYIAGDVRKSMPAAVDALEVAAKIDVINHAAPDAQKVKIVEDAITKREIMQDILVNGIETKSGATEANNRKKIEEFQQRLNRLATSQAELKERVKPAEPQPGPAPR
jgi:hypothetical protein